jgi:hypothetical protein
VIALSLSRGSPSFLALGATFTIVIALNAAG